MGHDGGDRKTSEKAGGPRNHDAPAHTVVAAVPAKSKLDGKDYEEAKPEASHYKN